jgi:hypothetical protein
MSFHLVTVRLIPRYCAEFGFVCKAHPAAHIGIRVGGRDAVDMPKDRQMLIYFLKGPLRPIRSRNGLSLKLMAG